MNFDWKDYVYLAEDLLKRPEESCLRSAISRAYYGVFGIARNMKGYKEFARSNIHWKVINGYKNSAVKNERNIGRILDKLRRSRNDADYNEEKTVSKSLTERAVYSARDVLAKLLNDTLDMR
jgi:uncharacterized protein (UPF0332 family)